MGIGSSLPKEDLEELLVSTRFSKGELRRWYTKFMRDYPSGELNYKEFMKLFSKIYKTKKATLLAEHIFRAFDTSGDDKISFKELMVNLSVTSRGTKVERLEWAFRVYDHDRSGYITVEEIHKIIRLIKDIKPEEGISCMDAEKVAEKFSRMDSDDDGQLSVEEFIEGVQKYPWFINMLNGTLHEDEPQEKTTSRQNSSKSKSQS